MCTHGVKRELKNCERKRKTNPENQSKLLEAAPGETAKGKKWQNVRKVT